MGAGEFLAPDQLQWNFCWRIEEALLLKALIAQAIMISPGTMKTT